MNRNTFCVRRLRVAFYRPRSPVEYAFSLNDIQIARRVIKLRLYKGKAVDTRISALRPYQDRSNNLQRLLAEFCWPILAIPIAPSARQTIHAPRVKQKHFVFFLQQHRGEVPVAKYSTRRLSSATEPECRMPAGRCRSTAAASEAFLQPAC